MAVALGQIVAEKHAFSSLCWYVYQPTGKGDWYRWRLMPVGQVLGTTDESLPCIAGVSRGRVYAGSQKAINASDANSGFTATGSSFGATNFYTTTFANYREFNLPEGMTHVRLLMRTASSGNDLIKITAYTGTTEIGSTTKDPNTGYNSVGESSWYALPSGTTKIRISKATDNAAAIVLIGLDFLNIHSTVDPDTAGSVMYCGADVPNTTVIRDDSWSSTIQAGRTSIEFALLWADRGGAFADAKSAGGLSHRGINTATIAWTTQTGTDAEAEWAPSAGDRTVCDYLRMGITTAKVYQESACTNWRGTLTGYLLFDASGCVIDQNVAVDQGTNMDVFQMYIAMCLMNADCRYTYFHGDEQVYSLAKSSVSPQVKSSRVEVWGGGAATIYTIELMDPLGDAALFSKVDPTSAARLTWVPTGPHYKLYMNYYDNTTTPLALDNGGSIGTRFAIRLRDRSLTRKHLVRLL